MDLTVLPATHGLSANEMNHAFAFPAKAGSHFTSPRGMNGHVGLLGWLHT